MTSAAMIAGMAPMALGLGQGGEQAAPLGRAVIGGLIGATCATLLVLPAIFAAFQTKAARASASLDPDDPQSAHFEPQSRVSVLRDTGDGHMGQHEHAAE
jgi:hypothetical protein